MRPAPIVTIAVSMLLSVPLSVGATVAVIGLFAEPTAAPPKSPTPLAAASTSVSTHTARGANDQIATLQQEVDMLNAAFQTTARTTPMTDPALAARIDRIQADLATLKARLDKLSGAGGVAPTLDATSTGGSNAGDNPMGSAGAIVPTSPSLQAEIARIAREEMLRKEEEDRQEAQRRREEEQARRMQQVSEWMDGVYERMTQTVATELGLSVGQIDAVRSLTNWRKQQLMLGYDPNVPRDQRPDWQTINSQFDEKMRTLLSPQQYQVYKDKKLDDMNAYQQQDGNMGGGRNQRGPGR